MKPRNSRPGLLWAFACTIVALLGDVSDAWAGEASTHFALFVPPNNSNNGRHSAVTITAHSNNTAVVVTDTNEDGDNDDSHSVTLQKGQSLVVRLREGAVNDDAGGVWDGDNIIIDSDKPVTAMLNTKSEWQHDWVPADGHTMRGKEFFMWAPRPNWDINVVAYENDTLVEIHDITVTPLADGGVTTVSLPGEVILRQTINEGEDLLTTLERSGVNLTETGHTYRVTTTKPATCMFGSFYRRERDGGGQVPSEDGTTIGERFFFPVPAGRWTPHEREIRIVAGDTAANVTLRGWSSSTGWRDIETNAIGAYGHLDFTGRSHDLVRNSTFFEVTSDEPVSVFEGNWLETGNFGTSDVFTYVSALDNPGVSDVGKEFIAYIGPPGKQNNVVGHGDHFSHLYMAGFEPNTTVTIVDVDTSGSLFDETVVIANVDDIADVRITSAQYTAMDDTAQGRRPYLRVSSDKPISVGAANWNDNWLAFPSGTVPHGLRVSVSVPNNAECNQTLNFDATITNATTGNLNNVSLDAQTIGDCNLLVGPTAIGTMTPGQQVVQNLTGQVSCTGAVSGQIAGLDLLVEGEDGSGNIYSSKSAQGLETYVPGVVGIVNVTTTPDACAVEVNWVTDEDTGGVDYVIQRRELGDTGAFAEVGRVASLAPAVSGFQYTYFDNDVTQGTEYQYMVSAEDQLTSTELSIAGPAIGTAGLPFTETPDETGDLSTDYETTGVTFNDATGDIDTDAAVALPGYDVDQIGVAYDRYNDSLYLAVSAVGIFGDGDGDGDPDTNTFLGVNGITDQDSFGVDEQFAFVLDFDQDGTGDAVVGIPFGGDIDFLQATSANAALVGTSPTLAFLPQTVEQAGTLSVNVLNYPSSSAPDLEIVVRNVSGLNNGSELTDFDLEFYLHASAATPEIEQVTPQEVTAANAVTAGCGNPASQIHLGVFAAFGNVFTGSPTFDFVPFGWQDHNTAEVYETAPAPVDGQVITSPTVFLPEHIVDIDGILHPSGLNLSTGDLRIQDRGDLNGQTFKLTSQIDWDYAAAEGDERYENIDVQVFRLMVTDCETTVTVTQDGTSGAMLDDRFVRLADDSVANVGSINPANTLAHSVIGTFETEGAVRNLNMAIPEDWVSDFGQATDPAFTQYAFLSDTTYVPDINDPIVEPFGTNGLTLPAGIWFVNYYLWTYSNSGSTVIETTFTPGADCGGTL